MNNIFKNLPWSTIRVLKYIVQEYKNDRFVDALDIRKHFHYKHMEEQHHLELLKQQDFIDRTGSFFNSSGVYTFRVTAKAWTALESFGESLTIFIFSSFVIPAIVSLITTLLISALTKK